MQQEPVDKLRSLATFNAERRDMWKKAKELYAQRNGIACPKCGAEMIDPEPNVTLTSDPPQKRIRCLQCLYEGCRVA